MQSRVEFIEKNSSFPFLLDFLANGVETLLKANEVISGLDLLKMFQKQFARVLFEAETKPGSEAQDYQLPELQTVRSTYYAFVQKWFDRLMALTQLYCETGLHMIQNKSAQSKGFQESDFLSERDNLIYNNLEYSKSLRVVDGPSETEMRIRNEVIRSTGQPEMHLRHGKLLMRFQELHKAKQCFLYAQDSFELAKFLYFYHKALHNDTEYELVLVKALIKVLNVQLFINAKPGMYRGQRGEKFKRLKINRFSDEECAETKVKALNFAKEVFYYYLSITRFFLLKDGGAENTTRHFKKLFLLKYFNYYLILMEELLRQEDTVPGESSYHFTTKLVKQMKRHFKFNDESCFTSEREAEKFLNFFGHRKDLAESLTEAVPADGKLYLLKLFYELRTNIYQPTISFFRKMDRELDIDLMDRIFFVYYNDTVPQSFPDIRDELDSPGYFEPAHTRQAQAPPNLFNLLLGGMAGGSSGGADMNPGNFMSMLNDMMQ